VPWLCELRNLHRLHELNYSKNKPRTDRWVVRNIEFVWGVIIMIKICHDTTSISRYSIRYDILCHHYKSLVRPHLEYCVAAWSPHYIKDKELIERIQRCFTKLIPDLRSLSYEERLRKTGLWTLEEWRVRADLVVVYKIVHGSSPVSFNTFFERFHNSSNGGHSLKLHKRGTNTDLRQHFFTERIINIWNMLDEDTVSANTGNSFKRCLQCMHTDGSFTRLSKSAWSLGPSQISGDAQTGKILVRWLVLHLSLLMSGKIKKWWSGAIAMAALFQLVGPSWTDLIMWQIIPAE